MVPALGDGDRVVVWLRPRHRPPRVGRIVIVELPDRPLSVKRVASVEADGRICVEGDNSFGSTDSRTLGSVPIAALRGVALFRLWPRPGLLPEKR
jgi:hypothetical protein